MKPINKPGRHPPTQLQRVRGWEVDARQKWVKKSNRITTVNPTEVWRWRKLAMKSKYYKVKGSFVLFFSSLKHPVLRSCQGGTFKLTCWERSQERHFFFPLINNVFFSIQASDALFNKRQRDVWKGRTQGDTATFISLTSKNERRERRTERWAEGQHKERTKAEKKGKGVKRRGVNSALFSFCFLNGEALRSYSPGADVQRLWLEVISTKRFSLQVTGKGTAHTEKKYTQCTPRH